jgi:phage terminase large subunit GpA-like protein
MIALAKPVPGQKSLFDRQVVSALRARLKPRSWDWICKNGRTYQGKAFDGERMPWSEGVFDALDDPNVREVVLMWGTRLGKTMIGLEWMAKVMSTDPLPGILGTATEGLVKRTMRHKVYPTLENIRSTDRQLLPKRFRNNHEIRLKESTWSVVWSGSDTMLADTDARYGWANEIDKWDTSVTESGQGKEGDPLAQFAERLKDWPDRKELYECSPSLAGRSRIARKFLESDQRHYYVPCPHCGERFVLRMGSSDPDLGGLKFDKDGDGNLDPDVARETARYVCHNPKCRKEIHDEHRFRMMRSGKWAPRGCAVDKKGRLCGTPERTCTVAGFQLSSLYSLQMRWGDVAEAFVKAQANSRLLQMFVNGWLSETWEPYRVKSEPEEVAERIATDDEVGVMPEWSTWLFAAVDVQSEYFKWAKVACGPGERVAVVDRGICDTWAEVFDQCVDSPTRHADGGADLLPALTLIDSGEGKRTREVYAKCKEWSRTDRLVAAYKGANTDCGGERFEVKIIGPDTKAGTRTMKRQAIRAVGVVRYRGNSFYYEPIIQAWLDSRTPDQLDSLSIPREIASDERFMHELCNGVQSDQPSKMNPDKVLWVKRWPDDPNDFRDCLKMARCAMDVKFRCNWRMAAKRQIGFSEIVPSAVAPQLVAADSGHRRKRRITLKRWRPSR